MAVLNSKPRRNSGIALIFVLGTVAIISVIAIEMAQKVQMAKMMVVERRDSVKALELAKAAYRWSLFRLQMDSTIDQVPAIPGTNYGGKKDDFSEIQWNFPLTYPFPVTSILSGMSEEQPGTPEDPGEKGTFSSVITDESARINLNDVGSSTIQTGTRWSGAASMLVNLLASPRFQYLFSASSNKNILDIPRAIDDWTDSDTQVNYLRGGDENTEYKTENETFKVKNGKMYTIDEMRMLAPMTYKLYEELKPFVTVYPFDAKLPRVAASPVVPLGKININTAPVEIIAAIFAQSAMTSNRARLECAQLLAKMRGVAAFRSVKQGGTEPNLFTFLQTNCGGGNPENVKSFIDSEVLGILDVRSDVFRIEASGFAGDIEKKIEAVVLRSSDKPKVLYWKVY